MKPWILLGYTNMAKDYLQEQNWFKDTCIIKAHTNMSDNPQMLAI